MTKKFGIALFISVVANGIAIVVAKVLDKHDPKSKAIVTNIIVWILVWPITTVYFVSIVGALISTIGVIASFLMDLGEKRALSRS